MEQDEAFSEELPDLVQEDQAAQQQPASHHESNPANTRDESIQRSTISIVHACQCRNANCNRTSCKAMKRLVSHTRTCRKRQDLNCTVCRQLIALCIYHAKRCPVEQCPVPYCLNVREMLQELAGSLQAASDNDNSGSSDDANIPDLASNANVASQQQIRDSD